MFYYSFFLIIYSFCFLFFYFNSINHDESYVPSITPPRKTVSRTSSFSSIPPSTPYQNQQNQSQLNGTPSGVSYSTPSRLDQPNFTIDRRGDNTYLSTIQERDRSQIQMQVSRDGSVNMVITPPNPNKPY